MKGIGIDIVEVKRFRDVPYKKGNVFYSKIFSDAEIKYCLSKDDPYPHFAARFAAKEAVLKCLKSTIYKIRDVEISNDKDGIPSVKVKNNKGKFLISLSHTKDQAAAAALLQ
ncbi:MAG: holo-ACP synthase [Patescibacteria group bacterium]